MVEGVSRGVRVLMTPSFNPSPLQALHGPARSPKFWRGARLASPEGQELLLKDTTLAIYSVATLARRVHNTLSALVLKASVHETV